MEMFSQFSGYSPYAGVSNDNVGLEILCFLLIMGFIVTVAFTVVEIGKYLFRKFY
jgi:hypothetical protein